MSAPARKAKRQPADPIAKKRKALLKVTRKLGMQPLQLYVAHSALAYSHSRFSVCVDAEGVMHCAPWAHATMHIDPTRYQVVQTPRMDTMAFAKFDYTRTRADYKAQTLKLVGHNEDIVVSVKTPVVPGMAFVRNLYCD